MKIVDNNTIEEEIWKDIKGYEGLYQISNFGNVKSLNRINKFYSNKTGDIISRKIKGKILKSSESNHYLAVSLSNGKKIKTYRIHRLVAEHFVLNPNNYTEINHKDENKHNNKMDNLEWCAVSYNNNYGTRKERLRKYHQEISKSVDCLQNGKLIKRFKSVRDAAECVNSKNIYSAITAINHCVNGRKKSAYGFQWAYPSKLRKVFFISDIHSGYSEMIDALNQSGYDKDNPKHLLVVLGDIFDRLDESVNVFKYLYELTEENRAIVTSGNHHKFLIDFLEGSNNPFNYCNNGMNTTLDDFLGRTRSFESYCLIDKQYETTIGAFADFAEEARKEIKECYPELLNWLKQMPRYFESKNYIGVHGALDTQAQDWRKPHCEEYGLIDWDVLEFDDGSFLGKKMLNVDDKTVVAGHFDTGHLRKIYNLGSEDDHSILKVNDKILGKKIFLDGCTILTKKVNVLVIDEEELLENNNNEKEVNKNGK